MENKIKKNPPSLQVDPNLFDRASDDEKAQIVTQRESVSFFKDAMRRLAKNRMAMICLFIVSSAYSISGGYNPFIYFNF